MLCTCPTNQKKFRSGPPPTILRNDMIENKVLSYILYLLRFILGKISVGQKRSCESRKRDQGMLRRGVNFRSFYHRPKRGCLVEHVCSHEHLPVSALPHFNITTETIDTRALCMRKRFRKGVWAHFSFADREFPVSHSQQIK